MAHVPCSGTAAILGGGCGSKRIRSPISAPMMTPVAPAKPQINRSNPSRDPRCPREEASYAYENGYATDTTPRALPERPRSQQPPKPAAPDLTSCPGFGATANYKMGVWAKPIMLVTSKLMLPPATLSSRHTSSSNLARGRGS